jgi:hypothetical protein
MALAVRSPMAQRPDGSALPLADRGHRVEEQLAGRAAGVHALVEGDEGDLRAQECGGQLAEVADAPGQAVELRDHEGIPPAPPLGQLGEQAL